MTPLQTVRFVRGLIDVAIEAAEASKNDYGKSYLHVSREKVDTAIVFVQKIV